MSNHGNYYYNDIPFKIKNVGTTYQRLIDAMLSKKIWKKLEAYIDDMIVKTSKGESNATHVEDIMGSIKNYNTHLNLAKCLFCIQVGKLLGYMLTKRGIEVDLYKI